MSWTRIDDQMHGHHKIKRVWKCRPALGLHIMAMSYSACYDLEGLVPVEFVEEKLPNAKERNAAVAALIDTGMWHVDDQGRGWTIHDWHEYNGSAKTREEIRATKSAAGKKGAAARWGNSTPNGSDMAACHSSATPSANGTAIAPSPSPSPTETAVESPVVSGRTSAGERTQPTDLAIEVTGILQRGIDGLTTDERCKQPTPSAVAAVLGDASEIQVKAAAIEARSIAQSQNRAPNIVALFAQRLQASNTEAAA